MYREILNQLAEWKDKDSRKALLLAGGKGVGKSYALEDFGAGFFGNTCMFDFKEHYIKAKGMNIFELNSPNQILMYFYICKQFGLGKKDIEVSVEELRDWLGIKPNEYQRFGDFNNWVLRTCEKALREHSDLCFTYEKGKMGAHGKCETIKLHIKENKKIAKKMEAEALIEAASTNNNETNRKIIELCEKSFNKKLNGIELDWIQTWINEYGITEDIVKLAIKDNSFRTYMTIKNVDDTLTKWHENNITTVEAAKEFCENEHKKNIRNAARNKNSNNSVWRTGEEAGIVCKQSELSNSKDDEVENDEDIELLKSFDDSEKREEKHIPESVLGMFGDADIDDDPDI